MLFLVYRPVCMHKEPSPTPNWGQLGQLHHSLPYSCQVTSQGQTQLMSGHLTLHIEGITVCPQMRPLK